MSNRDDASERPGDGDDQPPRVFISYSDDSPAHAKRVLELAQWLRSHGVDATLDQFEESPEEGWPRWIYRQIRESEFVLIIATPGYLRRCEHDEPRVDVSGSSVKFGSHLSVQELHEAGGRNKKFIPVLFGGDAIVESVPLPLRGSTCYRLPEQRDDLYRRLTGQPKVQRVPLGVLKTFDDETLLDAEEPAALSEARMRGRSSFDEQRAEDSFRAVIDAGLRDEPPPRDRTRTHERRGRARRRRSAGCGRSARAPSGAASATVRPRQTRLQTRRR
ncbi:MAG TPA: SEFIR domain-containing protein [Enhygromyxa sp.]|nr:SEFIR domain-containing protein [Enhygromyxa sp.]